jgi:hypothetical protein
MGLPETVFKGCRCLGLRFGVSQVARVVVGRFK